MSDVFLSYAREDRATAETLAEALRERGWSVWSDARLKAGDYWDDAIAAELRAARCVVVLWSEDSVQSHFVKTEAEQARERGALVPARIDATPLPYGFERLHTADLNGWRGAANHRGFEELVDGIAAIVKQPPAAAPARINRHWLRWWPLAIAAGLLIAAVSVLLLVKRNWTTIALDVKATGVSFTAGRTSSLSDLIVASEVAALGVVRLEIPRAGANPARSIALNGGAGVVRVSQGSLTLDPIVLGAGSRTSVTAGERQGEFRVRIDRSDPVTLNVAGVVRLAWTGADEQSMDFAFPKPMVFQAGDSGTDLFFRVGKTQSGAPPIPVTSMGLTRVEERAAGANLIAREVSTVDSGTLRAGPIERALTNTDKVLLKEVGGNLAPLDFTGDRLPIHFEGRARDVTVCMGAVCRDLRTNLAGWLWQEHRAGLLSAAFGYLALASLWLWAWSRR